MHVMFEPKRNVQNSAHYHASLWTTTFNMIELIAVHHSYKTNFLVLGGWKIYSIAYMCCLLLVSCKLPQVRMMRCS